MTPPLTLAVHRRRLTIAALVLLVLGGGLWWSTRPKIDPRLVGTWEWPPLKLASRDEPVGKSLFVVLAPSGSGTGSLSATAPAESDAFRWEVRRGFLYLMFSVELDELQDFRRCVEENSRRLSGSHVAGNHVIGWRILSVTPEAIELENEDRKGVYKITWTKLLPR